MNIDEYNRLAKMIVDEGKERFPNILWYAPMADRSSTATDTIHIILSCLVGLTLTSRTFSITQEILTDAEVSSLDVISVVAEAFARSFMYDILLSSVTTAPSRMRLTKRGIYWDKEQTRPT